MTTRSVLIAARALVAKGWCQGAAGRDERGARVSVWSGRAVQWSMGGAVMAFTPHYIFEHSEALSALYRAVAPIEMPTWNDAPGRTQAEVLAAFDRAIQECGE